MASNTCKLQTFLLGQISKPNKDGIYGFVAKFGDGEAEQVLVTSKSAESLRSFIGFIKDKSDGE